MYLLPEFNQIIHLPVNSLKLQVNQKMTQKKWDLQHKKKIFVFN